MYIERVEILYFVQLLDQSLIKSVKLNPLIDDIFAFSFDRLYNPKDALLAHELCLLNIFFSYF